MGTQTYRSRLIFYSSILMVFLIGSLVYSYSYTRSIILEESERNLTHTVRLLQSQIESERSELLRYAGIVSDDLRIQEYMFVVVRVGSDNEPLLKLYERLFGWLPIDRRVIISEKGNVLIGSQYQDLAIWVSKHRDRVSEKVFYFEGERGLELVAVAPIVYQGDQLGLMAVSRTLNRAWLQQKRQNSGGHVFIEKDGKIIISTLGDNSRSDFEINDGRQARLVNFIQRKAQRLQRRGNSFFADFLARLDGGLIAPHDLPSRLTLYRLSPLQRTAEFLAAGRDG